MRNKLLGCKKVTHARRYVPPIPAYRHVFPPLFLSLFCLLILSDVDSMHFVTFLLLHVKRFQLKIDLCYGNSAG